MPIRLRTFRPLADFLAAALATLFTLALAGHGQADETAPSPCGKTFAVTGDIQHFSTPKDVTVEGGTADNTYSGEVFAPTFTAVVEGLPEGDYTVEIDEAEVFKKGPGQRIMHITSGDTVIADKLDVFAEAGFAKAYQVRGKVHHAADSVGGPLTITFTGVKDNAKFNAIQIDDAQGNGVACVKAGRKAASCDSRNGPDASFFRSARVLAPALGTAPATLGRCRTEGSGGRGNGGS